MAIGLTRIPIEYVHTVLANGNQEGCSWKFHTDICEERDPKGLQRGGFKVGYVQRRVKVEGG